VIDTEDFCRNVAGKSPNRVTSEQVYEAVGGITNLYLKLAAGAKLEFESADGFSSEHVPLAKILREIGHCTGVDRKRSERLFQTMVDELRDHCLKDPQAKVQFGPIGTLQLIPGRKVYSVVFDDTGGYTSGSGPC